MLIEDKASLFMVISDAFCKTVIKMLHPRQLMYSSYLQDYDWYWTNGYYMLCKNRFLEPENAFKILTVGN